jgi:hypothetical protein
LYFLLCKFCPAFLDLSLLPIELRCVVFF